jgi:hypothetical protein
MKRVADLPGRLTSFITATGGNAKAAATSAAAVLESVASGDLPAQSAMSQWPEIRDLLGRYGIVSVSADYCRRWYRAGWQAFEPAGSDATPVDVGRAS